MSSGSFICEKRRPRKWRLYNETAHKAIAQCVDEVHREKLTKLAKFKWYMRAEKIPGIATRQNAARGDGNDNDVAKTPTVAPDDNKSPKLAALVLRACEVGLQNNVGVEHYSEFMNVVARAHGIPVADMWNLTLGEWRKLEHKWPCAATQDGVHYHKPTMWKQVRLWFDLFRKDL